MKIFKHRNFMSLIFSVIVSLPFLSVLCRSAYVVVNKNAKDSYSGYNGNEVTLINDSNDLIINRQYKIISSPKINLEFNYNANQRIYFTNINVHINNGVDISTATSLGVYSASNSSNVQYVFYDENNTNLGSPNTFDIDITYIRNTLNTNNFVNNQNSIYLYTYLSNGNLDNAFEYSISRFVDENHWGKLNFFEWFNNLFIDINSNNNTLYLYFINWYMNYFLMVSCAYILFLVLMWFINYSRRLLERGMNYDW